MKLKNINRVFIVILIISIAATLTFIFSNSLQKSDESWKKSNKIAESVESAKPTVSSIKEKLTGKEMTELNFKAFIRKSAHFVEFMLLGIEIMLLLLLIERKITKLIFFPMFFCLAAADADEYIQTFSGRTSMVKDVIIDFSGATIGIFAVCIVFIIVSSFKSTKNKTKA